MVFPIAQLYQTGTGSEILVTEYVMLGSEFKFPCGSVASGRLIKAAMTEAIANPENNHPSEKLQCLYRRWALGGGEKIILFTGNVFVDKNHMERAANVVIDGKPNAELMKSLIEWRKAGTAAGNHFWMQLNHAGRATLPEINSEPLGPSNVLLDIPGGNYVPTKPMTEDDILRTIDQFADAAIAAKDAGFTGVQLHGAHGYLVSQFLSPHVNKRDDKWGGSLENRARMLLETLKEIRKAVGVKFPIGVKLNSADFQKGGFDFDDCKQVVAWLNELNIDLLELSGGTNEHLKYFAADAWDEDEDEGVEVRKSTKARESYFIDYAAEIKKTAKMPIMVTGGFRSRVAMVEALESGYTDFIGVGRPFCSEPDVAKYIIDGACAGFTPYENDLKLGNGFWGHNSPWMFIRTLNVWGTAGWFFTQIARLGEGRDPDLRTGLIKRILEFKKRDAANLKKWKKARR